MLAPVYNQKGISCQLVIFKQVVSHVIVNNLNEAEYDIKNSANHDQRGCYPQRPKADVDNTLRF